MKPGMLDHAIWARSALNAVPLSLVARGIIVLTDPTTGTVTLKRTKRARSSFSIRVDRASCCQLPDQNCQSCRADVLGDVLRRVFE